MGACNSKGDAFSSINSDIDSNPHKNKNLNIAKKDSEKLFYQRKSS